MSGVQLLGAAEVRRLAAELDVTPTKRWGQNFVVDQNTVRRIVQAADVRSGDAVVEIGPGLGSLTLGLVEAGASVTAVEIDPRLAARLPRTVAEAAGGAGIAVLAEDAMTVTTLPEPPRRLVANLPYNVSVPVLLHFLERFDSLESALVMVQAEVGHRLAAPSGSKVYGGPSIKAAWYGVWRVRAQISRQVFWPVPNVDSVLVGFERGELPGDEADRVATFRVVDQAFLQRRKMLRGALSGLFGSGEAASDILSAAGVSPEARGESLGVADFLRVAREARGRGLLAP